MTNPAPDMTKELGEVAAELAARDVAANVRPFQPPKSDELSNLMVTGEKQYGRHVRRMRESEERSANERSALVGRFVSRMREISAESTEALREFDTARAREVEKERRLLAVLMAIRDA